MFLLAYWALQFAASFGALCGLPDEPPAAQELLCRTDGCWMVLTPNECAAARQLVAEGFPDLGESPDLAGPLLYWVRDNGHGEVNRVAMALKQADYHSTTRIIKVLEYPFPISGQPDCVVTRGRVLVAKVALGDLRSWFQGLANNAVPPQVSAPNEEGSSRWTGTEWARFVIGVRSVAALGHTGLARDILIRVWKDSARSLMAAGPRGTYLLPVWGMLYRQDPLYTEQALNELIAESAQSVRTAGSSAMSSINDYYALGDLTSLTVVASRERFLAAVVEELCVSESGAMIIQGRRDPVFDAFVNSGLLREADLLVPEAITEYASDRLRSLESIESDPNAIDPLRQGVVRATVKILAHRVQHQETRGGLDKELAYLAELVASRSVALMTEFANSSIELGLGSQRSVRHICSRLLSLDSEGAYKLSDSDRIAYLEVLGK